MRKYPEDELQMACARYLDLMGWLWMHPANERKTSPGAGARLKKKGVKSGVPDILIFEPNGEYIGLAIELKTGKNKLTEAQEEWLERLGKKGWYVGVCYSFDQFKSIVDSYFNLKD